MYNLQYTIFVHLHLFYTYITYTTKIYLYFQYGDNTHTLIDRSKYGGVFLPGYKKSEEDDVLNKLLWVSKVTIIWFLIV